MKTVTQDCPLLNPAPSRPADSLCSPGVLEDLADLAFSHGAANLLSTRLHAILSAQLGKPGAVPLLLGLQEIIFRGEAAGVRLAAAFLDVTTPGARLIPRVQRFSSTRRLQLRQVADNRPANPFQKEWGRRLARASTECQDLLEALGKAPQFDPMRPGRERPWPALQNCFLGFLEDVVAGRDLTVDARTLMADLIRLETDAWQERNSQLAGSVDPFRTEAVQRVLPILSRADSQVQDLRQLITWIEDGNDQAAFTNQVSCALEVMDDRDHRRLRDLIENTPSLENLGQLSRGLHTTPLEIPKLARGCAALLAVGHQLRRAGLREDELGLFQALRLTQDVATSQRLVLPLGADLAAQVREILKNPQRDEGLALWPTSTARVVGEDLVVDLATAQGAEVWEDFLPHAGAPHPLALRPAVESEAGEEAAQAKEGDVDEDLTASAVKHLVMSNIMSTSVTLGFLRNPKVVAIPGLVAEVAVRTRNPQIIETIANDRTLHTGFANRDVPRVCLQSPCNASIKVLRKFVHVKYVSKLDLKRMAEDRAGIRREVIREIRNYLEALS